MPTRLRVVTNSELKTRRRCPREHHYSYELGFRSAREDALALRFGTVMHAVLEAWWHSVRELRLEAALEALAERTEQLDAFELARALEMLNGYDARWRDAPYVTIAVEQEFRAAMVNPDTGAKSRTFELGGKLDVIVQDEEGRVWLVEHKTSSDDLSPGSLYWQMLQLDTQVSVYYAGMRSLGFDPAGVIYDVLGKPQLRPLKATPVEDRKYRQKDGVLYANQRAEDETPAEFQARVREAIAAEPDSYLLRGIVVRTPEEEAEAAYDTWSHAQAIRDAVLAKRWPRNPDSCRRFGRLCTYFGVCSKTESITDPALFRQVTNTHEELTPAAQWEQGEFR